MAETIHTDKSISKANQYASLLEQLDALVAGESDLTANLANIMAVLKYERAFFWAGVYRVEGEQLILGPFQGPLACTRIPKGKGVCGSSWAENKTIVVEDVDAFPGHISCSALSKSEVVIPIRKNGEVAYVLDIDSEHLNHFDQDDKYGLEQIAKLIERLI